MSPPAKPPEAGSAPGPGAGEAPREAAGADEFRGADALVAILDSATNALAIVDNAGRLRQLNRAFRYLFELDPAAYVGRPDSELLEAVATRTAEPEHFRALVERYRGDPELAAAHRIGTQFLRDFSCRLLESTRRVSVFSAPILARGKRLGAIWSFGDVTEMLQTEEQLRTLADASPIPTLVTRRSDGCILYVNDPLARILGTHADALVGTPMPDLHADPKDREAMEAALDATGEVPGMEVQLRTATGELRWAQFRVVSTTLSGEEVVVAGVFDIHERRLAEEALERKNRELEAAHAELKSTQSRLVQSEKMASLGMLVAGIAHEINTPIGAVSSMHDTLVRATDKLTAHLAEIPAESERDGASRVGDDPKVRKLLGFMEESNRVISDGTRRVTAIVRRLKSFARLDEAELKDADLHEGLETTLTLIHHELKHGIEVIRDYGVLPTVKCFPGRLNQVFLNLLMNARQAVGGEGTIRIRTWAEGSDVLISVADSGPGIAPDIIDRVFDPGFTTKGVGVGTGLGLSICYQILEDHHGSIDVVSPPGEGATFTLRIPVDRSQSGAPSTGGRYRSREASR